MITFQYKGIVITLTLFKSRWSSNNFCQLSEVNKLQITQMINRSNLFFKSRFIRLRNKI